MSEFVHSGRRLIADRKFQEAVKVCRLGLLKEPACLEGRLVLAQALMSLARYDEVLAESRAALELDTRSSEATILLGEALFFKGAYGQARDTLRQAAALAPEDEKVQRLLAELDATAEAGLDMDLTGEVSDSTRAYPREDGSDAGMSSVGDETEIQQLPPNMAPARGAGPRPPAPGAGGFADLEPDQTVPSTPAFTGAGGFADLEPDQTVPSTPAFTGAGGFADLEPDLTVPAAPGAQPPPAVPDEDRPAPVAGEVQVTARREPPAEAHTESVDISHPDLRPSLEGPEPPVDPDATVHDRPGGRTPRASEPTGPASAEPPDAREGSRPGRRWADRRWLRTEDAHTREALVVPSPRISTEEMRNSDLFRRQQDDQGGTQSLKGRGEADGEGIDREAATAHIRPDGLGPGRGSRPDALAPGAENPLQAVTDPSASPWDSEDEETIPRPAVSPAALQSAPPRPPMGRPPGPSGPPRPRPEGRPGAPPPYGAGGPAPPGGPRPPGPRHPPPRPGGPAGRPPAPGYAAGPGGRPPAPRPGLPHPGAPAGGPPPGSPGLPAPGRPPGPAGSLPPRPGPGPGLPAGFAPPPAGPPPGVGGRMSLPPLRPPGPAPGPPGPGHPQPGGPRLPSGAGLPAAGPRPGHPQPGGPRLPSGAGLPAVQPYPATTAPASAPRRETTAKARRPLPPWLVRRWKLYAGLGVGVLVLIVGLLIVVAAQKGKQSEALNRLYREGLDHLARGRYADLQRADEVFRRLLQRSSTHREARQARLFVVAALAMEFGHGRERAVELMERTGEPSTDLGAAGRCLAHLAAGKHETAAREATSAARRFPKSAWVAYARAWVERYADAPDGALTALAGVEDPRARTLILRSRVAALLELGRTKEAAALLVPLPEADAKAPWAVLLRLRVRLAEPQRTVPLSELDGAITVTADSQGRVSALQRRWAHLLLADAFFRLGKDRSQRTHTARALAEPERTDPAFLDLLALHLLRIGDAKQAEAVASAALVRFPGRKALAWAKASAALREGRPADALAALQAVPPQRRTARLALVEAMADLSLGRTEEARRILRQLRRDHPALVDVRLAWARLLIRDRQHTQALAELEAVLRVDTRNVEAIQEAARLELARGKTADAVTRFEAAVRLRPADPGLRAELVEAHLIAQDWKSAENALDSAVSAFPKDPGILTARGRFQLLRAKTAEAAATFRKALELDPKRRAAALGLAAALLTESHLADAEAAVAQAEGLAPEASAGLRGWFLLLRWDLAKGDPAAAAKLLGKAATARTPAGLEAAMHLIELDAKRVERRAAEAEYRRQRRRHGDRPELQSALGLALVEDDANASAIATLKGALRAAKGQLVAPTHLARMHARLAQAHWQAGNFPAAQRSAKRARALWAGCGRALALLGIVDYERTRFRTARQHLREAVDKDPTLALSYHYLGLAEQQLGQRRAARKALGRALELRPRGPLADEARRALKR